MTPGAARLAGLRERVKAAGRGLARVLVLPLYGSYRVRSLVLGEKAFRSASQAVSRIPGLLGDYLRREFYRLTLDRCARDCQIEFGTLFASAAARVGDNVYIGSYCMIADADIGRDVLLGSNVHLLSGKAQHGIEDPEQLIRLQPRRATMIRIGENTWIGNGSIVMANIGHGCVVGAGSVVIHDLPDRCIAGGNPARVLRRRDAAAERPGPLPEDAHNITGPRGIAT
jgi:acetyltransferase-like isoleucine patch superfamily enzyme